MKIKINKDYLDYLSNCMYKIYTNYERYRRFLWKDAVKFIDYNNDDFILFLHSNRFLDIIEYYFLKNPKIKKVPIDDFAFLELKKRVSSIKYLTCDRKCSSCFDYERCYNCKICKSKYNWSINQIIDYLKEKEKIFLKKTIEENNNEKS